ncbi:MAG: ATP-binding cassette domain-containing protein [Candidatus Lokiarchaeota archaeon]|nr:ATP-binding cassette domain-containing protein [Candidatus Lokiarchaeota archaeon]
MIEIKDLTKDFNTVRAVDHINLEINEGEVFGFLGPNGAGKTTTIRMLNCLIKPTSGVAYLDGNSILEDPMKIRKIIGVLTENPCIYERLSGEYNLKFFGKLYEIPDEVLKHRIKDLLEKFNLIDRAGDKSGTYSKGMKQKLAIIRTLLHDPKILIFDEPTAGLDPKASKDLRDYIKMLSNERKITIFLCTHNLSEAEYLCDKIAVINNGKIVGIGRPKELSRMLWSGDRVAITLTDNITQKNIEMNIEDIIKRIAGVNECIIKENRIQISTENARKINPLIIRKLIESNQDIVEVKILGHSLEDIYLSLIKDNNEEKSK